MTLTPEEAQQARQVVQQAWNDWRAAPYAWHWSELVIIALDKAGFIKKPNTEQEQ